MAIQGKKVTSYLDWIPTPYRWLGMTGVVFVAWDDRWIGNWTPHKPNLIEDDWGVRGQVGLKTYIPPDFFRDPVMIITLELLEAIFQSNLCTMCYDIKILMFIEFKIITYHS